SYTFTWSDTQNGTTASNLCTGTVTVTVTDGNGCTANTSATINENTLLEITLDATTDVSCNSLCDGDATVSASGGDGSYTFTWSDAQNGTTASNLCAGTVTVTVTDGNGCTDNTSATIIEPTLLSITTNSTDVACNGGTNGSVSVSPTGGTTPYTYNWDNGAGTTASSTGLAAGTYNVTVTDGNGCVANGSATINENPLLTASIDASTDVSCNGLCDGDATVTAAGGEGTYEYIWDDALFQTNASATSLCAGTYNVTVEDGNGCTATDNITINENPALTITLDGTTDVSCNGLCDGDATVSAAGGDGSYTFTWSDAQVGATASNLCAGTVTVTVTDGNGCTASTSATINENNAVAASISSSTDVTCNGNANGSATVDPTGGDGNYIYVWDDPSNQTDQTASGLSGGTYNVTVEDGNGCQATTSVTIIENPVVTAVASGTDAQCNAACDGTALVTPGGGDGTYEYDWDDTGFSTDVSISGLCAGTYNVTVTDGNGCFATSSYTVAEPAAMVLTPSSLAATCGNPDGTASVSVAGGTSPYTYDWSPDGFTNDGFDTYEDLTAGAYDVVVTDANLCSSTITINVNDLGSPTATISGSTNVSCNGLCDGDATVNITGGTAPYTQLWNDPSAQTGLTASGLCAGSVSVTVTDNVGCIATASVSITQNPVLAASITGSTDVSCNGLCDGTATVSANGGTGAGTFDFEWSDGSSQTTTTASALCAGSYDVTVTDDNGCSITKTVTISENPLLTASIDASTDVTCNGICDGTATVTVNGGTGAGTYIYLWDDPAPAQTVAGATALCAGTFTVTVTDGNGCVASDNITINENPAVTASISGFANITCNGACDGEITASAGGGDGNYSYVWDDASTQTTFTASGLCPGTYNVTVSDGLGCTAVATQSITQNPALNALITGTTDVSCNGLCDGSATVSASGGTGAGTFDFIWSDGSSQTTTTASGLCTGSYQVTVTDDNGCEIIKPVTINENPLLTASIDASTDVTCNGLCDGDATVTIAGGDLNYTIEWSDGLSQSTTTATALCAGSYDVTITDGNGCIATDNITINENLAVTASASATDVSVFGACDGTVTAAGGGGDGSLSYEWDDAATSTDATVSGL
ncbi:MAG: hypothetical protein C0594_08850, partial [Marinilabiliales bacterium]